MTVVNPDGSREEIDDSSSIAQAYRALQTAAERIGRNNCAAYVEQAKKLKSKSITISAEHEAVVQAMPALLAGKITPQEAMALLHDYDVRKQRLSNPQKP